MSALGLAGNENQNILSAVRIHQVSPHQRDINIVQCRTVHTLRQCPHIAGVHSSEGLVKGGTISLYLIACCIVTPHVHDQQQLYQLLFGYQFMIEQIIAIFITIGQCSNIIYIQKVNMLCLFIVILILFSVSSNIIIIF